MLKTYGEVFRHMTLKKARNIVIAQFESPSNETGGKILTLTSRGELKLYENSDHLLDEGIKANHCIKDAYLFETLEDIYWQPSPNSLCAHLHPPTSKEMAHFLVQQYVIPVMRDLEIMQCGLEKALKQSNQPKITKALHALFNTLFQDLEKAQKDVHKSVENDRCLPARYQSNFEAILAN